MKNRYFAVALLLLVVLAYSGCGSDNLPNPFQGSWEGYWYGTGDDTGDFGQLSMGVPALGHVVGTWIDREGRERPIGGYISETGFLELTVGVEGEPGLHVTGMLIPQENYYTSELTISGPDGDSTADLTLFRAEDVH